MSNVMVKQAYNLGAVQAEQDFTAKLAEGGWESFGDYATPTLGAVGMPWAAGLTSAATAPKGTSSMDSGVRSGLLSAGGGVVGGLGGGLAGAGLGYGGGQLARALGADLSDEDVKQLGLGGALLGGGAGAMLGGGYGAHLGREAAKAPARTVDQSRDDALRYAQEQGW